MKPETSPNFSRSEIKPYVFRQAARPPTIIHLHLLFIFIVTTSNCRFPILFSELILLLQLYLQIKYLPRNRWWSYFLCCERTALLSLVSSETLVVVSAFRRINQASEHRESPFSINHYNSNYILFQQNGWINIFTVDRKKESIMTHLSHWSLIHFQ